MKQNTENGTYITIRIHKHNNKMIIIIITTTTTNYNWGARWRSG